MMIRSTTSFSMPFLKKRLVSRVFDVVEVDFGGVVVGSDVDVGARVSVAGRFCGIVSG